MTSTAVGQWIEYAQMGSLRTQLSNRGNGVGTLLVSGGVPWEMSYCPELSHEDRSRERWPPES